MAEVADGRRRMHRRRCGRISTSTEATRTLRATSGTSFLPLGGSTSSEGYGVTAGYTVGYGRLTNNASINWNRSHVTTQNYFTDGPSNPAGGGGRAGGEPDDPDDPVLLRSAFAVLWRCDRFTGLTQALPNDTINQTISFSDFVSYSHKKHNMRYGLDIRRVHADSIGGTLNLLGASPSTPLGAFSFTGYATQNPRSRLRFFDDGDLPGTAAERIGVRRLSSGAAATVHGAGSAEQDLSAGECL